MKFICLMFLILFQLPGFLWAQRKNSLLNLFEKEAEFISTGNDSVYHLPDAFIIEKSEKVWLNGKTVLRGRDYHIDYQKGKIRFEASPAKGSKIKVSYRRIPVSLKRVYFHRRAILQKRVGAGLKKAEHAIASNPVAVENAGSFDYALNKRGSITRSITVGSNQGLRLDSGLRLQISGNVGKDVEVIAALTDQNAPIQPEGNTQTLQEIDKVFVQIRGSNFQATLGDFNLDYRETDFGSYSKKLQGAMGEGQWGAFRLTLSGAVARGKFTTNQFMGVEGKQGPYQLWGERGQRDIIVLAGSERVWVDGELMTRGENNDYVIEYSNGQITFTRHRLITADSRITVDFQYSDQKFRRNLFSMRAKTSLWEEKLKLGTTWIRESDDRNSPLERSLSEQDLNLLRRIGDYADSAFVAGYKNVGENKGTYNLVDSLGIQFFRYVGPDSGSYNISFSYLGPQKGDYVYQGFGIYRYVGKGLGSYLPRIYLPLASSHNLAGMDFVYEPSSTFAVAGEFAVSDFDKNTYSRKDDADNLGKAYNLNLRFKPEKLKVGNFDLGKLEIATNYRFLDNRFREMGRFKEIEYNRRWDLTEVAVTGEKVVEIRGSYNPVKAFLIQGGYGKIEKGSAFNSSRWEVNSTLNLSKRAVANYRAEFIDSRDGKRNRKGRWLRQRASTEWHLWKLRPSFYYEGEIKKAEFADSTISGFEFDDWTVAIHLENLWKMNASTEFSLRNDKAYVDNALRPKSQASTQRYKWALPRWRSLSATMEYTHRIKDFHDPEAIDIKTDLIDLHADYSPPHRAIIFQSYYQVSNLQMSKREKVYLRVGEGLGNYIYDEDLGEYLPDVNGDFILRTVPTDEYIPVTEVKTRSRIRINPRRFFKTHQSKHGLLQTVLANLSAETYFRLQQKSKKKETWNPFRGNFQKDTTAVYGNMTIRQDVFFLQDIADHSLRFRYFWNVQNNNQYTEGRQEELQQEEALRWTSQFLRSFGTQIDLYYRRRKKDYHFPGRGDKDVRSKGLSLDFSYRPQQALELALKTKVAHEVDNVPTPNTEVTVFGLMPRLGYSFQRRGRLRVELDWTKVEASPRNRVIPFEMAMGNRVGQSWRWRFNFDYRISSNLMASVSYSGRNEPGRLGTIHVGRAEVKAFF